MNRVPYTRIPGLTDVQQHQIDRNFQEAAKQIDEGAGPVRVPYRRIPGLDPETQRQIDRNFLDLFCSGGGGIPANTVPPGTVLTSDSFNGRADGTSLLGDSSADLFAGGTAFTYLDSGIGANAATIKVTDFGGGTVDAMQQNGAGGSSQPGGLVVDTGQPSVDVAGAINGATFVGSPTVKLFARYVDPLNYVYATSFEDGGSSTHKVLFGKVVGGVDTLYGASPYTTLSVGTLHLVVSGAGISVKNGGTIIGSVIDTDAPTGTITGFWIGNGFSLRWASWSVTAV